ncbi:MAG TPA: FAD-linked oxidase C-terminal domain-containing protein [Labilithrix sp.]|nr:FAD-linked oxidase C-terminal domain-containing protein [Labilithrix sp.]
MQIALPEVPLPSRDSVEKAVGELDRRLGVSKVDTSAAGREAYARDDSAATGRVPDAVVMAQGRDDVATTLEICQRFGVPVTPRAAGTGRTGGAVPVAGGIVLATHGMSSIVDVDRNDLVAVVQPGVITGELHEALEAEGLFYPPDPNSLASCMIGGNVAENAGGPRAFKYGVTREYVLGLEVCLMGGRVLRTGRRTVKGVTGYDVTSLLVGSEGTLGVFTEIVLKLVHAPTEIATVLALYENERAAAAAVERVIARGLVPRCLELMDEATLAAIRRQSVAIDPRANALLLVEVDGRNAPIDGVLEALGETLSEGGHAVDVVAAQDAAQRTRLWEARRMLSVATRKLAKYKLSEDVVVPRSRLVRLLEDAARICERGAVRHVTYGHAGDGNLHVNFLWDDDAERPAVETAIEGLMRATVALGGTLSGEHGIGISKAAYLPLVQGPELLALQQDLKRVFDPSGLLNPGKIFPTRHAAC